jgi:hypothetical protein
MRAPTESQAFLRADALPLLTRCRLPDRNPTKGITVHRLRAAESIGRPLGDDRFLARIERMTARTLRPAKAESDDGGEAARPIKCTVTVISRQQAGATGRGLHDT